MTKLLLNISFITTFLVSMTPYQNTGCHKKAEQVPKEAFHGLWIGAYKVDGEPRFGEQYFSFIIKPDGTMINDTKWEGQQHISVGSWTLNGNLLSCTATCISGLPSNLGIKEKHEAKIDKSTGILSGTWKNAPPLNGSGTFTLTKVN